jgi:hypothetical protein
MDATGLPAPSRLILSSLGPAKECDMAVVSVRNRTRADLEEVARRVAIYTRQVEEFGHVMWLPNVMAPKVRMLESEQEQTGETDD